MINDDDDRIALILGFAVVIGVALVWRLSSTSGLTVTTSGFVFSRLITLLVIGGLCWMSGGDFPLVKLSNMFPILFALLWWCWWPALDLWTNRDFPVMGHYGGISEWRGAWYTKWSGFALVFFFGNLLKK